MGLVYSCICTGKRLPEQELLTHATFAPDLRLSLLTPTERTVRNLFLVISGGQATNTAAGKPTSIHFTPVGLPAPTTTANRRKTNPTSYREPATTTFSLANMEADGSRDPPEDGGWRVKPCRRCRTQKTALPDFCIRRAGEIGRWLWRHPEPPAAAATTATATTSGFKSQILYSRYLITGILEQLSRDFHQPQPRDLLRHPRPLLFLFLQTLNDFLRLRCFTSSREPPLQCFGGANPRFLPTGTSTSQSRGLVAKLVPTSPRPCSCRRYHLPRDAPSD